MLSIFVYKMLSYLQGFFGSLREEFILNRKDISVTICTIGFVATENVLNAFEEFRPGLIYRFPIEDTSESALKIIKGGAQRLDDVQFPKIMGFIFVDLYNIIPGPIKALGRSSWY